MSNFKQIKELPFLATTSDADRVPVQRASDDITYYTTKLELKGDKGDKGDTGESNIQVVVHGSVADVVRPVGSSYVMWIGTVEPTNSTVNDIWYDIS